MTLEKLGAAGTILGYAVGAALYGGWGALTRLDRYPPVFGLACDVPNVVVRSAYRSDASVACEGVRDAREFLASQGLDVSMPVSIDVVEALPPDASPTAAGSYLHAENRVVVLSYSAFEKHDTWFDVEIHPSLYRSLVAHEVAHSIAAANFVVDHPTVQAHEYIAYVTMFETMAPAQRHLVLAQYPGDGFEHDGQISTTIYLFDPMRFGVRAYRHFLRQSSGREYLRAILAGDVLAE